MSIELYPGRLFSPGLTDSNLMSTGEDWLLQEYPDLLQSNENHAITPDYLSGLLLAVNFHFKRSQEKGKSHMRYRAVARSTHRDMGSMQMLSSEFGGSMKYDSDTNEWMWAVSSHKGLEEFFGHTLDSFGINKRQADFTADFVRNMSQAEQQSGEKAEIGEAAYEEYQEIKAIYEIPEDYELTFDELAGIFDHSGGMKITLREDATRRTYYPELNIAGPKNFAELFQRHFDGSVAKLQRGPNNWNWRVTHELAHDILQELIPRLSVRHVRAKIVDAVWLATRSKGKTFTDEAIYLTRFLDRFEHYVK